MSIDNLNGLECWQLFTQDGKDVWRVQSYCEHPTVTMVNVETGETTGGAVGCLNLKTFKRLVEEK